MCARACKTHITSVHTQDTHNLRLRSIPSSLHPRAQVALFHVLSTLEEITAHPNPYADAGAGDSYLTATGHTSLLEFVRRFRFLNEKGNVEEEVVVVVVERGGGGWGEGGRNKMFASRFLCRCRTCMCICTYTRVCGWAFGWVGGWLAGWIVGWVCV
jgi:hypothetical protein